MLLLLHPKLFLDFDLGGIGSCSGGKARLLDDEKKLPLRDDYFIENYVNDPRTTPEAELITEILVPTV